MTMETEYDYKAESIEIQQLIQLKDYEQLARYYLVAAYSFIALNELFLRKKDWKAVCDQLAANFKELPLPAQGLLVLEDIAEYRCNLEVKEENPIKKKHFPLGIVAAMRGLEQRLTREGDLQIVTCID